MRKQAQQTLITRVDRDQRMSDEVARLLPSATARSRQGQRASRVRNEGHRASAIAAPLCPLCESKKERRANVCRACFRKDPLLSKNIEHLRRAVFAAKVEGYTADPRRGEIHTGPGYRRRVMAGDTEVHRPAPAWRRRVLTPEGWVFEDEVKEG
jgi:hypothetical protein